MMTRRGMWAFVLTVASCATFQSAVVDAGIISANDPLFGVGAITVDTSTGFEWLDLSLTANISAATMNTRLSDSLDPLKIAGFRRATLAEVQSFFTNAGITGAYDDTNRQSLFAPADGLLDLLGALTVVQFFDGREIRGSTGMTATPFLGPGTPQPVTTVTLVVNDNTANPSVGTSTGRIGLGGIPNTADETFIGHFLVRSNVVPEPSALLLSSIGLGCVALCRRRRAASRA